MIWLTLNFTALYIITGNITYGFLYIPISGNVSYQVTYVSNNTVVVLSQGYMKIGNEVKNISEVYKLDLKKPLYFFPFTTNETLEYLKVLCNETRVGETLKVVCNRMNSTQVMIIDLEKMIAKKILLSVRSKAGTMVIEMRLKGLR